MLKISGDGGRIDFIYTYQCWFSVGGGIDFALQLPLSVT